MTDSEPQSMPATASTIAGDPAPGIGDRPAPPASSPPEPEPPTRDTPPPLRSGIEADGLTRHYGDHVAVDDVRFEIRRGEVFGLLGPNGAGKTTLLRMLAGILVPTSGVARLAGIDVQFDPREAKRQLGFLSGDTALYARLSVTETLRYFGRLYHLEPDELEARIETVTREFGLEQFSGQRCGSLSSGQNQRVNLARAFLADPPILILDEPTVGLDVISGHFVIDAIERARAAGKSVLFSTHIMSEVDRLCDRIGILLSGRLRMVGTRSEILAAVGVESLADVLLNLHARDQLPPSSPAQPPEAERT